MLDRFSTACWRRQQHQCRAYSSGSRCSTRGDRWSPSIRRCFRGSRNRSLPPINRGWPASGCCSIRSVSIESIQLVSGVAAVADEHNASPTWSSVGDAIRLERDLLNRAAYYVASVRPFVAGPVSSAPSPGEVCSKLVANHSSFPQLFSCRRSAQLERLRSSTTEPPPRLTTSKLLGAMRIFNRSRVETLPPVESASLNCSSPLRCRMSTRGCTAVLLVADDQQRAAARSVTVPDVLDPTPPPSGLERGQGAALSRAELEVAIARLPRRSIRQLHRRKRR